MEVSGEKLALQIRKRIKKDVLELKKTGVNPKIAIITLGGEESWKVYVGRKLKFANECGIAKVLISLKSESELFSIVNKLNRDPKVHGIIVQRPLPGTINRSELNSLISRVKDIDGFRKDSKHQAPIWQAVRRILEEVGRKPLTKWLKTKKIVVVGKGESGGELVIKGLKKLGVKTIVIDSRTQNRHALLKHSDIVISCVGKKVIEKKDVSKGVILISVGIHRNKQGKLEGDYDEDEIRRIASFYTPTPGGVGPLNLSYLFKNLIDACRSQTKSS